MNVATTLRKATNIKTKNIGIPFNQQLEKINGKAIKKRIAEKR